MKTFILVFGMAGFALVAVSALIAERPLDLVLRDAALGCLVFAWCGRRFALCCAALQAEGREQTAAAKAPPATVPTPRTGIRNFNLPN